MDLTEDNFHDILLYLPLDKIMSLRLSSKQMMNFIDSSYIWCEKLRKDFNVIQYNNCFNVYIEKYKLLVKFFKTFNFVTPFMNNIFHFPNTINILYQDGYYSLSNSAKSFYDHIMNIQSNGLTINKNNFFDDNQINLIMDDLGIQDSPFFMEEIYSYNNGVINEYLDLFAGIIVFDTSRHSDVSEHIIDNKYLDIFTFVWGGDINKSRREKLIYIIKKQNELISELLQLDEILNGEEILNSYYVNNIYLN